MRFSTATIALAAATGAAAQLSGFPPAVTNFIGSLSSGCQQTVLSLALGGPLSQCLQVQQAIPIVTQALSSNTSLIPVIDQLVSLECGQSGCSNATLTSAWQQFASGCATDLGRYNVSNTTVQTVFQQYPLAREVVCLRTRTPYNATVAPIPLTNPPYNITNGTAACLTSVLTAASAKIGQNISVPFITSTVQSLNNNSAPAWLSNFTATDICNDCIFGAADLIGVVYPQIGNASLTSIGYGGISRNANVTLAANSTVALANLTVAQALNSTCSARNFTWTSNGTLPGTVLLGAYNSTFSFNITAGAVNRTYTGATTPIKRNVAELKGRWIGEQ